MLCCMRHIHRRKCVDQLTRKKHSTCAQVEQIASTESGCMERPLKVSIFLQAACTGYFDDSDVVTERAWTNPYQNYDNVGKAILSLFIAVTLNGYSRKPLLT